MQPKRHGERISERATACTLTRLPADLPRADPSSRKNAMRMKPNAPTSVPMRDV